MLPIEMATWVGAIATVLYVVVSFFLWLATMKAARAAQTSADISREVMEASHRPYLGLDYLKAEFTVGEAIRVTGRLKNDGTVAADSAAISWAVLFDGQPQRDLANHLTCVVNPTAGSEEISFTIGLPRSRQINDGSVVAEVIAEANYTGVGRRTYRYSHKLRYETVNRSFRTVDVDGS